MYVCISGWVCSACYPWASVSFWAHHTVAPCWHRWPRFRYKCALIAIPVTARTEPSRAYARQALGSMGSLVRFMGHNCTSASCGAWSLSHNTEDGQGVRREAWGQRGGCSSNVATLYAVCCACRCVSASLWVLASIIHAWHALPHYLYHALLSLSLSTRLFARLPAQEHPKAKFSLASAKSSELNVSIDSKRHCQRTHTEALCNKVYRKYAH